MLSSGPAGYVSELGLEKALWCPRGVFADPRHLCRCQHKCASFYELENCPSLGKGPPVTWGGSEHFANNKELSESKE